MVRLEGTWVILLLQGPHVTDKNSGSSPGKGRAEGTYQPVPKPGLVPAAFKLYFHKTAALHGVSRTSRLRKHMGFGQDMGWEVGIKREEDRVLTESSCLLYSEGGILVPFHRRKLEAQGGQVTRQQAHRDPGLAGGAAQQAGECAGDIQGLGVTPSGPMRVKGVTPTKG